MSENQSETIEKSQDRLTIIAKIAEYEKNGNFHTDVEDDPPTIPLEPNQVDYLNKNPFNWIMMKIVNSIARRFINKLIKTNQLIIKEVVGIENYIEFKNKGVILTCNHFNPFDNFAVYKAIEKYLPKKELHKIIREGNFTNFPGFYGFLFRHCNTFPLSSNFHTLKKCFESLAVVLKRNQHVLIYPEQAMWWNYKKPRPLTNGAFKIAAQNNVPILPIFITLTDSALIGNDGFPIQEYTINILKPIFPDENLSIKENMVSLRDQNYNAWKDVYEDFYGIPLSYES